MNLNEYLENYINKLNESKADQQAFIDQFSQDTYDKFQKYSNRLSKVIFKGKPVSKDLIYHIKNTSNAEMQQILDRAENREYEEGKIQNLDIEGKLIPIPADTKKKIKNKYNFEIYQVFDYSDMIDLADPKYLGVIGKWCIAGRYPTAKFSSKDVNNNKVKVSQAKELFYDYIKKYNLMDSSYFVLFIDGTKYCILISQINNIKKIFQVVNSEDKNVLFSDSFKYINELVDIFQTDGIYDNIVLKQAKKYLLTIAENDIVSTNIRYSGFIPAIELLSCIDQKFDNFVKYILCLTKELNQYTEKYYFQHVTKFISGFSYILDDSNINEDVLKKYPNFKNQYKNIPDEIYQKAIAKILEHEYIYWPNFIPDYIKVKSEKHPYFKLSCNIDDVLLDIQSNLEDLDMAEDVETLDEYIEYKLGWSKIPQFQLALVINIAKGSGLFGDIAFLSTVCDQKFRKDFTRTAMKYIIQTFFTKDNPKYWELVAQEFYSKDKK